MSLNNIIENNSKIAVLLGVYNGGPYLRVQLDSLISQTFRDWTLYIRDDASTDNTKEIIREYCSNYNFIKEIDDEDGNLGCNGNYFRLLSCVESKYYMFCNADDYWFKNKIEISYERMVYEEKAHPMKPVIVHTDLSISDHDLNIIQNSYWEAVNTDPNEFKSYNLLGLCNISSGATMIFNNSVKAITFPVHKDAPFFDHWMSLKVVKAGIIATINEPTISYRQIGTNLAAVSIGKGNTILGKIFNLKSVFLKNRKEARMLKNIGWGGTLKYLYYKVIILLKLRFGKRYKSGSVNIKTPI